MSLHNLNTPNKQWLMYLNTLSSISGDNLIIKPDTRRNLLLEVSGNNSIFIKKGDISYNLTNYITGDASFSNVDVSVNLNPLQTNSSLGIPSKLWGNAYIRDISVTNISVSGNMTISGTISNVIQIIPRLANDISSSLGSTTNIWQRAFIRDLSSISTINGTNWSVVGSPGPPGPAGLPGAAGPPGAVRIGPIGPIGPAGTTTTGTWRDISNLTLTTYNRIYQNMYPKYELNTSYLTWEQHRAIAVSSGKTLAVILNAEQNEQVRLIAGGSSVYIGGLRTSNLSSAGERTSAFWQWVNGDTWSYTNFNSGEPNSTGEQYLEMWSSGTWNDTGGGGGQQAVYMSYEDPSWNAVTGYYGLAKDAYPSLNPLSSGVLAVSNLSTRRRFSWTQAACCWSPQLLIFVGVGYLLASWSEDGINWTQNSIGNQDSRLNSGWTSICWSPELMLFVAVADSGRVMRSSNGISWTFTIAFSNANWASICWSPQLMLFVATGRDAGTNNVITSSDGITWYRQINIPECNWNNVCWSAELGIFLAASDGGTHIFMISRNGINWTGLGVPPNAVGLRGICWSKELGLFVGVSSNTSIISNNGLTWSSYSMNWSGNAWSICWIPELKLFVVINDAASFLIMNTSTNGINWNPVTYSGDFKTYRNITWSPEFGIFVCISNGGGNGAIHTVLVSSLKGRPPTSYNVFDSSFNRINENGIWDFSNINVTALTVNNVSVNSDDRLKHNEVVITNGLNIIDRLTPKFYQKTQVLLDASYNGDLSAYAWSREAGLIAQEVLQISDLSYVVGGGDYYEQKYNLITQTQDVSANYYELSNNYYEPSANNYEISYNLVAKAYNLNYNSVFVYGLAAIKELHTKVKAQESTILNQKNIISSLLARIQALEK